MVEDPKGVKFHYIKSPLARDLHINGAYGGITPAGDFHMSVFAERPPIPQAITFEVNEGGSIGGEIGREGKEGYVRVVQDTLYMDLATAMTIHKWLGDHIQTFFDQNPALADFMKAGASKGAKQN